MTMPKNVPQPMTCQDYDTDVDSVRADTLVQAKRNSTSSTRNPPRSFDKYKTTVRDHRSDSGYSSRTSDTQESKTSEETLPQPQVLPIRSAQKAATKVTESVPAKAKALGRSNSTSTRKGTERTATAAPSAPRRNETFQQPTSERADHVDVKLAERRSSVSVKERDAAKYAFVPPSNTFSTRHYQEPDVETSAQTTPRPMQRSKSRSRPKSMHEGFSYSSSYDNSKPGPPPSMSASYHQPYAYEDYAQTQHYPPQHEHLVYPEHYYPATHAGQESFYYTSMPPYGAELSHAEMHPRQRYADPAAHAMQEAPAPPPGLARTYSTRDVMPTAFPDEPVYWDEHLRSPYEQDSGLGLSEEAYVAEKERAIERAYEQDARAKQASLSRRSSTSRRPDTKTDQQRSREDSHRKSKSHDYDYRSYHYPDHNESRRSSRVIVDEPEQNLRTEYRPALSRNPSSSSRSRTVADSGRYVVTRTSGREKTAPSARELRQREQDEIQEQMNERARRQDKQRDAEAYQKRVDGPRPPDLTAATLKKTDRRHSVASVSQRSSRSSRISKDQSIKLLAAGCVPLEITGNSVLEFQRDENGDVERISITNVSGKEKSYHGGSRSSGSRVGRSRGGSERGRYEEVITEEYEPGF